MRPNRCAEAGSAVGSVYSSRMRTTADATACEICGILFEGPRRLAPFDHVCPEHECFEIKFWRLIADERDEHVVIGGECYAVGPEDAPRGCFRGFDGRRFTIRMFATGEVVTTTNLWHQGRVPDFARAMLPDTGEFVDDRATAGAE